MDSFAAPRISPNFKPVQKVEYGDDSSINAQFEDVYVLNEFQTEMLGRSVEDHKIQITMEYPGNNLFNYKIQFSPEEAKKGNEWTRRFPRQWEAFSAQRAQVPDGTPLEVWAALDKRRVLGFKSQNIHTVEQVAALTDATGPMLGMDWRKIRDMATTYLKPEMGTAALSKLTRENDDLKNQMEAMQKQISMLVEASPSHADAPKRRGRKPKVVIDEISPQPVEAENGNSA